MILTLCSHAAGVLGDSVKITKDKSKLTVTTEIQMSKRCEHLDCCWHGPLLMTLTT